MTPIEKHRQRPGVGTGPFDRLPKTDFLRREAYWDENRAAVGTGLAALEAFEDVDMIPLGQGDAQGNTAAERIIAPLAQVVPLVCWYHLFNSFPRVWKEVQQRDAPAAFPDEMAAQAR
jgi:hypothetical protein